MSIQPRFACGAGFSSALVACVAVLFNGVSGMNRTAGAGTVRYVALNGSDEASGAARAPFRTISKALSGAGPGDTVHIRAGVYTEHVVVQVSGKPGEPILIEGERGKDGEWRTIVDTSVPIHVEWLPAPEIGKGVYKAPYPGFEPHQMLVDGKFIPRIWDDHMADGLGFKKLAYPPDQAKEPYSRKTQVKFWDTVGAMFGFKDGKVYLRFRNYDDPNTKDLRAAPAGGGIHVENRSYIILHDLMVRGGEYCVLFRGPRASHNVIERCRLLNGSKRVMIDNGASHNVVRNNEMTIDFYSDACRTGAWGTSQQPVPYDLALKVHFYRQYKMFFGPNATSDYGIRLYRVGPGNEVCENRVYKGGQGISVHHGTDVRVHGNTVYGFSSIGIICTLNRVANVQVYDNIVYDCNINLRIHHVNEPRQTAPRTLYVYRNRFYQNPGVGSHIYFHYWQKNDREDYLHPHVYIYHNSFAGGQRGISISGYADECGGLPNAVVLNNVVSSAVAVYAAIPFIAAEGMWKVLDFNWLGGGLKTKNPGHDYTQAPWYGDHNIYAKDRKVWDDSKMPDFTLPPGHPARNAGTDLSKPFVINGKTFEPLPGMEPGYFKGDRPDLGAVQSK